MIVGPGGLWRALPDRLRSAASRGCREAMDPAQPPPPPPPNPTTPPPCATPSPQLHQSRLRLRIPGPIMAGAGSAGVPSRFGYTCYGMVRRYVSADMHHMPDLRYRNRCSLIWLRGGWGWWDGWAAGRGGWVSRPA